LPFFNMDTLPTASIEGKNDIVAKIHNCARCGLSTSCLFSKIPATGEGKKRILVIGNGVTSIEDSTGNAKHGNTYSYLKKHFKTCGIDLEQDCWYTHATRCYTKRKMGLITQSACHRMLMKEIEALDPLVIVPTCQEAWDILLYERLVGRAGATQYSDWCGESIPDQVLLRWIAPIYSPAFVSSYDDKRVNHYHLVWHQQVQNICTFERKPEKIEMNLSLCHTEKEAIHAIEEAMDWKLFAFDYETTGIKPYAQGHKIAYVSFSNGTKSFSFKHYHSAEYLAALKRLLTNNASKIAQNANFERSWTHNILGYDIVNLNQDTMLLQHALNNRKPTGLKFMVYAYLGFLGYDADCDEYLKAPMEDVKISGSNAINRIFDAPVSKVLKYNAMDSLFTAWIFSTLYPRLDREHQLPGYKFFMEASIALNNAHEVGIRVDMEALEKTSTWIENEVRPYIDKVMNDPLILSNWRSAHKFNPRSDHDIRTLLFTILKLEAKEFTEKGQPSVDAETLYTFKDKVPIIDSIFQVKRLGKLQGTYIGQMRAEQTSGIMRSFYNLNRVVTYRSNSGNVNFQNSPKRDKESKKIIRSLYFPRKGHFLKEIDLKGAEVSIAASVTGDKNLIKYVSDPTTDMHRDLAKGLFMVDEVSKNLRGNATKGPWTFAQFYGSWWKQCAAGIWSEIDIRDAAEVYGFDVVRHLRKCGIKNYDQWEKHCEEQEHVLWDKFFPGYKRWRDETYDLFCEQGYIDYADGFRYYGPATKNEVLNAPVQGPAFHTQLWAFTESDKEMRRKGMDSRIIGQIHDSILLDVCPAEEASVDSIVYKYLVEKISDHYPWITVPIVAEVEKAGVDEPWSMLKEVGKLEGGY
jgi:DNA polymerase I-like protein with 3'-5' exonuclease and polymerase domains/uracil-DNA glycosylase